MSGGAADDASVRCAPGRKLGPARQASIDSMAFCWLEKAACKRC